MFNEHEIRVETAKRLVREHIADATKGYLPVDENPKSLIDFTLAHKNASYNDGYVAGLKTALDILEGVFQIETTEAQSA